MSKLFVQHSKPEIFKEKFSGFHCCLAPRKDQLIKAFTLVELAIVLVIIGLLTAGVVGGQSLIESAKMNSQMAQFREFDQATGAFKLEYDKLPGDLNNAWDYWGSSCSPYGAGQCNGNGDGKVGTIAQGSVWQEPYMFFPHLTVAKLTKGTLTHAGSTYIVGEQFPKSGIGENGVSVITLNSGLHYFIGPTLKSHGAITNAWTSIAPNPALTVKQASTLDKKLDDGIPNNGSVRAVIIADDATNFNNDTTTSCIVSSGTAYNLTVPNAFNCRIIVKAAIQ